MIHGETLKKRERQVYRQVYSADCENSLLT